MAQHKSTVVLLVVAMLAIQLQMSSAANFHAIAIGNALHPVKVSNGTASATANGLGATAESHCPEGSTATSTATAYLGASALAKSYAKNGGTATSIATASNALSVARAIAQTDQDGRSATDTVTNMSLRSAKAWAKGTFTSTATATAN